MRLFLLLSLILFVACGGRDEPGPDGESQRRDEPPVALDAEPPVVYPPALYQQGVEGTVTLQLFVDEQGSVIADSTRVAESSGYPEFDSAAVAGIPRMRFAPAQRDGRPVGTAFTQPVQFRLPRPSGASQ